MSIKELQNSIFKSKKIQPEGFSIAAIEERPIKSINDLQRVNFGGGIKNLLDDRSGMIKGLPPEGLGISDTIKGLPPEGLGITGIPNEGLGIPSDTIQKALSMLKNRIKPI